MLARLKDLYRAFFPSDSRSAVLWDANGRGSRAANWQVSPYSPNQHHENPALVRSRAEGEYRNNPFARRAVDAIVNASCGGSGIAPMFRDRAHQAAWEAFSSNVYVSGRIDWAGFCCLTLRTVVVSGEAFVLMVLDPDSPGNPLRLQVLGPEYLDTSRSGPDEYMGIRYRGARPIGYWLWPRNPAMALTTMQSLYVPAESCLHVYREVHPGAQRGQSWLAPVLLCLRELSEFMEAALVRQKIAALYSGYVRTQDGGNPLNNSKGEPILEPGSMTRLNPGEEVEFSEPPDAGATFEPFVRAQLRRIAAGMGLPYELLSGDLGQVTFASGRHGLLEFRRTIEAIQYAVMVPMFCEPIMRRWARLAAALGEIDGQPSGVRWIGPPIEMLDPRQEVLSKVIEVRAGFTSRTEVVSQRGWRAEDIDSEIAADNARADRLGLILDSDPRRVTQQGQGQNDVASAPQQEATGATGQ